MAHVLIVTLGPIQDFIAAARRTRDLWFGSWLLSELSKATAQAMADDCGLESLVFPGVSKPDELYVESDISVANKIVLRVPDAKTPAAVAERGREGMRARLNGLCKKAFDNVNPRYFERETAKDQVDDLIEYAWVSAPEAGPNGYAEARRKAEELLAARKNTRLWGKVKWGAEVPKSSIDGERESVLREELFDLVGKEDGLTPKRVRELYGVGPTERLCGVGLLKRHGTRKSIRHSHNFLSTGHLAAWPIYRRLEKTPPDADQQSAWETYLETLEKGGADLKEQRIAQAGGRGHLNLFAMYDGSLLFENRLPDLFEEITDTVRQQESIREARKALSGFLAKIDTPTPLPYYAILVADGDRMGHAIERQTTFEAHQALSQALDRFAHSAQEIVEEKHGGELVYSGGDDVLAFVPLHRAVDCARVLAGTFQEYLSEFPVDEENHLPTLSAGIGVSHFMDPLRSALNLARKAEALAKEERNSLAIIVDKRSGPPVEVKGIWGNLDKRLDAYVEMHRKDWVPDGAAYELRELGRLLDKADETEKASLVELVRKEAERILGRKHPQHGAEKELAEHVLKRLVDDVKELDLNEVADGLIVARLLAQAWEEAEPTQTGGRP